ncbi:MAG: acyl carrier protein [Prevotellaceae bacterium]|nr:acyl carrier protein [Candidatus Colivivens equi]
MDAKVRVIEIIAGVCEVTPEEITLESTIGDFPTWDSIGHLTILSQVEEAFNINFDPEEMMDLEDVSDIIKAVEEKL